MTITPALRDRLTTLLNDVEGAVLEGAEGFGRLVDQLVPLEEEVRFFHADEVVEALQDLSRYLRHGDDAPSEGAGELLPIVFRLRDALDSVSEESTPEIGGPFLEWDLQHEIRTVLTISEESQRIVNSRISGGQSLYLGIVRVARGYINAVEEALQAEIQIINHSLQDRSSRITFLAVESAPPPVEAIVARLIQEPSVVRELVLRQLSPDQLQIGRSVADEWYGRLPEISVRVGAADLERIRLLADAIEPHDGDSPHKVLWQDLRRHLQSAMTVDFRSILSGIGEALESLALEEGKNVSIEFYGNEAQAGVEIAESLRKVLFELLANAIIHGAEIPDVRVASGKAATARVTCNIETSPGGAEIRVADDGRGFDGATPRAPRKGGLRRARAIVERELGGTLRITSRTDGVTAHVDLPALNGLYRALIVRRHGIALLMPSALVEWAGEVESTRIVQDTTGARFLRFQRRLIPLVEPEYAKNETRAPEVITGDAVVSGGVEADLTSVRSGRSITGARRKDSVAAAVLRVSKTLVAVTIDAVEREAMVPTTSSGTTRLPGDSEEMGHCLLLHRLPL